MLAVAEVVALIAEAAWEVCCFCVLAVCHFLFRESWMCVSEFLASGDARCMSHAEVSTGRNHEAGRSVQGGMVTIDDG